LQGEIQWRIKSLETLPKNIDPTTESLKRYLPKLIKQWLVTEHPALPFHESLFETEIEDAGVSEQESNHLNTNPSSNEGADDIQDNARDNSTVDITDELDAILNKAMRKTKLAQKKQFPPAPLWQAVFDTLKGRVPSEHPQLVGLPTKEQYKSIAQLLGQGLGQMGQVGSQTLSVLIDMLALDSIADVGDAGDSTKRALIKTVFDIREIDVEGVLAYQVRHPAKAFLRTQKVHVVQGEEAMAHQEPLFLDSLTTYQIKEHLINELATDATDKNGDDKAKQDRQILMYQKIMPAGVARQTTLRNQQQKLQQQCLEFKEQLIANGFDEAEEDSTAGLQLLTPTSEYPVQIELAAVLNSINNKPHHQSEHHKYPLKNNDSLLNLLPKAIKIKG
jgi:exodeoxyribonuclease V gamma subunit